MKNTIFIIAVLAVFLASPAARTAAAEGPVCIFRSCVSPGYSIPTIDLAGESERQTVVDRETGQYLGHPTTVLLDDNRIMIAVYPKGHGRGPIVMKRSPDGGLTWSERLPTPASWETSLETPAIFKVARTGGTRLLLFSGLYPIRLSVSEDLGKTWSELKPIGEFGGIVAMSSLMPLADGRLLALFHDDGRYLHRFGLPGRFRVFQTVSSDHGLSWGPPREIASHPLAMLCEPGAVRSPDGREIAVLLRENSRRFNSFVMFSQDEGASWSKPRETVAALTGDRHVARYARDGRLVITFRDMARDSATRSDWVAWVGRYEDLVSGNEGQYRVRLMHNTYKGDCGYPGLEVLADGTMVAVSYGHWTAGEPPYIVAVRFRPEELDARARR